MAKLTHLDLPEYPSFVTTKTTGGREVFASSRPAEILIDTIMFGKDKGWYKLISFVVMPDHLHFIVLPEDRSLSDIIQSIKGFSAKKLNEKLDRSGPIWERGFYDYLLDSREKILTRIRYIKENPVKNGLVDDYQEYPFSSVNYEDELDWSEYL